VAPGLIALIIALACALAGGAVWRRANGRMRAVRSPRPEPTASGRAAPGPARSAGAGANSPGSGPGPLTAEQLGQPMGERATLVQFSSAFCAPCRATRRILTDVARMVDGVTYIEVDAESHLDLVRRLNVLRTPTVLVTDGTGQIVQRGSGQPRKSDVIAALGQAVADDTIPAYLIGNEDSDSGAQHA
jgi:thiol-disulfide isomerase/thioredoxin